MMLNFKFPFVELIDKINRIFNKLPEGLSNKLFLSIVTAVLVPLLDLAMASWMYVMLMVLQQETVSLYIVNFDNADLLLIITVFILIAIVRQLVEFMSIYFSRNLSQDIFKAYSLQLLNNYLSLPWGVFIKDPKAIRIKYITVTALDSAYSFQVALNLLASLVSLLTLGVATFIKEPSLAIISVVFLVFFAFISKKHIKPKMHSAAASHETYQKAFHQKLYESLSLYREIKVFNVLPYFYEDVEEQVNKLSKAKVDISIIPHVPRITMDLILTFVLALGIFVITTIEEVSSKELIASFATIAVLARRIITSMSTFLSAMAEIDFALINTEIIEKELKSVHKPLDFIKTGDLKPSMLMSLRNVSFSYSEDNVILKSFSIDVNKGDRIALLGETGKGKSTILMIVAGFLQPADGEVLISQGFNVNERSIAYVPQEVTLLSGSIAENILFGFEVRDESLLREVIRVAELETTIYNSPKGLQTEVGENGVLFSGGQRQRIGIARALYRKPSILLLDEATSALDEETELNVMQNINEFIGEGAVLFITHRKEAAKVHANKVCSL